MALWESTRPAAASEGGRVSGIPSLEVREVVLGGLDVAATAFDRQVVIRLPRDDVRTLVQVLDEWLYDSRPGR
jgi:hypothetical protein